MKFRTSIFLPVHDRIIRQMIRTAFIRIRFPNGKHRQLPDSADTSNPEKNPDSTDPSTPEKKPDSTDPSTPEKQPEPENPSVPETGSITITEMVFVTAKKNGVTYSATYYISLKK